MTIFIDSSVFCAYANADDVHHKNALDILRKLISENQRLIITDYVFGETLTVVLRRKDKKTASELGSYILNSEVLMAKLSQPIFEKAWETFCMDNKFSFTDCTIIAFMRAFEIGKIATFDKEFKKLKNIEVID